MTIEEINAWRDFIQSGVTPFIVTLMGLVQLIFSWRGRVAAAKAAAAAELAAARSSETVKHLSEKTDEQTELIMTKTDAQTTLLSDKANVIHGLVNGNMTQVLKANSDLAAKVADITQNPTDLKIAADAKAQADNHSAISDAITLAVPTEAAKLRTSEIKRGDSLKEIVVVPERRSETVVVEKERRDSGRV